MNEQFFTLEENYKQKFFKLPQVFFTNENYKTLSNDAKIAYAILENRLNLSIKNNWIDENGVIYFIYTNDNLMSILNLGKNKIIKIKKELESVNLLVQKRQGLNKPNMLYLMKPIVTEDDIYKIQESENLDKANNSKEVYKTNFQEFTIQTSGGLQNKLQEVDKTNSNDTDNNNTNNNNTDNNDLNNMSDNNINNSHSYHTDNYLKEFYLNNNILDSLPKLKSILNIYNAGDIKIILDTLWKAVSSYEKECNKIGNDKGYFAVEDIEDEIINVIKRFTGSLKAKNESVSNMQSYLMTSFKNAFRDNRDKLINNKREDKGTGFYNWLEE